MQRGFSLVELSIVLIILGLLVGGVLAGKSMLRAAELRVVVNEGTKYTTAVVSFRDKYLGLPGDIIDGTKFWGRYSTTNCTTNSGAAVVATGTCDGNGDGQLATGSTTGWPYENFQYWRQLATAGFIEGTYSGVAGTGGDSVLNDNIPASRLSGAGWSTFYKLLNLAPGNTWFQLIEGNVLFFGADYAGGYTFVPALKPEEAWNLDTKLDDGFPGQGAWVAIPYGGCTTATSNTDYAATYKLTNNAIACGFAVMKGIQ